MRRASRHAAEGDRARAPVAGLAACLVAAGLASCSAADATQYACHADDPACEAPLGPPDPGATSDGGIRWPDAASGNPPPGDWPEGFPAEFVTTDIPDGVLEQRTASCLDGADNDGDAQRDCEVASCRRFVRACCQHVRAVDCCEPLAAEADLLTLVADGCEGTATTCLRSATSSFGATPPRVEAGGALVPAGGFGGDSGVVLEALRDDPSGTTLVLQVRVPTAAECGGACIDHVGAGVVDLDALSASVVRPAAGVVVSAGRREAQLVADGAVAARVPLPADVTELSLTFEWLPGGELRLGLGDAARLVARVRRPPSAGNAVVAVWGRTSVAPPASPAALLGARMTRRRCEAPGAWTDRAGPLGGFRGAPREVDVLRDGATLRFAYVADDAVLVASRGADDPPGDVQDNETLLDAATGRQWRGPDLARRPDGTYVLHVADASSGCVFRATGAAPRALALDLEPVVCPSPPGDPGAGSFTALSDPSLLPRAGRMTADVLFVRAVGSEAGPMLLALPLDGAGRYRRAVLDDPRVVVRRPSGNLADLDADDVAAPDVAWIDGAAQLWYAARTGSRWSIAMLVSSKPSGFRSEAYSFALEDLWSPVPDATIAPSSRAGQPDALSVFAPSVTAGAGRVDLVHAATDGSRDAIVHRRRATTTTFEYQL
jgi:hypothetical protein